MFRKSVYVGPLFALLLSGCAAEQLDQFNRSLADLNTALGAPPGNTAQPVNNLATMPVSHGPQQGVQLIVPDDANVKVALDAALPTIKKVLSIHQCLRDGHLQSLNFYAVPGVDMNAATSYTNVTPMGYMPYHDHSKCVSVRSIDTLSMPALNALQFRTVYFADDSGETVNFNFLFKKVDDGSWRLATIQKLGI